MARDLALDSSNDLQLNDRGDLAQVGDVVGGVEVSALDGIAQDLRLRLGFVMGEWFLDESVGVPYFEQVFIKNPSLPAVREAFRAEALKTPGVLSVTSLDFDFDRAARKLTVTIACDTDEGELTVAVPAGVG